MRISFLLCISLFLLSSCQPEKADQNHAKAKSAIGSDDPILRELLAPLDPPEKGGKGDIRSLPDFSSWAGVYVGAIPRGVKGYEGIKDKILFSIESISDNKIKGYSMMFGVKSPLLATYTWDAKSETINAQILSPSWKNKEQPVPLQFKLDEKRLRLSEVLNSKSGELNPIYLKKAKFAYNKKANLRPQKNWFFTTPEGRALVSLDAFRLNGSQRVLNDDVLKNVTAPNLRIIRNTIFARHGYAFKKESMRTFFENNPNRWYLPLFDDVEASLTKIERVNVVKLRRFEKYDKEFEWGFGR